ncbi:MAG: hypothetical protein GY861_14670 [bacterium]|nr:hypothetical protein [bacterium]
MADNFSTTAGDGTGPDFASDDIGSVQYPRGKFSLGADGSAADALGGAGAVAAGVQRVTLASDDPAVTDLAAIEVLNTTIAGDTTSIDGKITACNTGAVTVSAALPAGTNLVGNVKISDGTETANVNASNELQVRDDDANTDLDTIAGDTTSIDGKITACNTGAVVLTNDSIVGPGDPVIESSLTAVINFGIAVDNEIVAAPGADKQIWVYGYSFSCGTADGTSVLFEDEDNTALSGVMLFAQYGGMSVSPSGNFSQPIIKVATNKALDMNIGGGEVDGTLTYSIVDVS